LELLWVYQEDWFRGIRTIETEITQKRK